MREGNLEAPTRHAIDWKNPGFYDQAACEKEMERIFDICHGCRRCVSLCNAFPLLFDLIDEAGDEETAGVPKEKFWKVVDQCYLCDVCYMTKCPYVPPHQWNLDFPHTMLRAKAIQYKTGKMKFRDKLLTSTELVGTLSSIPVVAQVVNAANKNGPARAVLQKVLGVDARRQLPEFDSANFRADAPQSHNHPVRDGKLSPGKVAVFSTCYVNYNEPGLGHDLLKLLEHNEIPYVVVKGETCCGMPKLELGDLDTVEKYKERNIPRLHELAQGRLRDRHPGAFLHPDVQGRTSPAIRRRRALQGSQCGHVRSLRILRVAPEGWPPEDRLQGATGQGVLPHPLPLTRAECRQEDRGNAQDDRS
jgi:glycerol-3-phosphate dehydrogenase subunit C